MRDLLLGRSRFKEFAASPESIPTNILADRLERLVQHKIADRIAAADGSKHGAYELTSKGKALLPIVEMLRDWGLAWEEGTKAMIRTSAQSR